VEGIVGMVRRRVLIVTSSYAPAMTADMHRARQLAWELPPLGWDVEILTAGESYQQPSFVDDDSSGFFAPDTPVHRAPGFLPRLFKVLGLGNIGWRVLEPMRELGDRLLASGRFDLIYFSTTQFPLFLLGPRWQRRSGISYILDFHDPCFREDVAAPVWAKPSLKHQASRRLAGLIESHAVSKASGLVAVSPKYIETLRRRYSASLPSWVAPERTETIPFGVLPLDIEEARRSMSSVRSGAAGKGVRIVYVGAGGPIMERAFGLFCRTLAALRDSDRTAVDGVRVEVYGTMSGWREGERRHLAEVAVAHGVGDIVHEDPRRVSYRRSLELLLGAQGALILGVDEAAYMPSKLFTYAYSGKPLLAVVRRDGPAFEPLNGMPMLCNALWFGKDEEISQVDSVGLLSRVMAEARERRLFDRRALLASFTAAALASRHARLFGACHHPAT
jgi:hypothetical protein